MRTNRGEDRGPLQRWFEMEVVEPLEVLLAEEERSFDGREGADHPSGKEGSEREAAQVVSHLLSVWEDGAHFEWLEVWKDHAVALLARGDLPAHAGAALCVHGLVAGMVGTGDLRALERDLPRLQQWVTRAESPALGVLAAAAEANLWLMRGHLHAAGECLRDASYLLPDPREGQLPKLYLALTAALARAVGADLGPRTEDMVEALGLPSTLPVHLQLTARSHRVLYLARSGQLTAADAAADELRVLAMPAQRDYFLSYMHYALGVADLLNRRPGAALTHADLAISAGRACSSTGGVLMPALLRAQALMDLGRDADSLVTLDEYLPRWSALGYDLQLMSGQVERAFLLARGGHEIAAAQAYHAARAVLPDGEVLRPLHRGTHYLRELQPSRWKDHAAQHRVDEPPFVQIQTLGAFSISVGGRAVGEREWGGRKSIKLLRLLISHGGQNVPANLLCDTLWPDSDGAQAQQNLKVALWRVRRIGAETAVANESRHWVVSRHSAVSLDMRCCAVDVLQFTSALEAAQGVADRVWEALELYTGDFLPDETLPAAALLRERLRNEFVHAVWVASEQLLTAERPFSQTQLKLLKQAASLRSTSPHGHALLMAAQLSMGQATEAMMAFYSAEQLVAWHERSSQDLAQLLALKQEAARLLRGHSGDAQVFGHGPPSLTVSTIDAETRGGQAKA